MKPDLRSQVLSAFREPGVLLKDCDPKEPRAQRGAQTSHLFTLAVDVIRKDLPSPRLKALGEAIWGVFHHQHVMLGQGPQVPSLSFATDGVQAFVLAPPEWANMALDNPARETGAVVMCGSQAVDFYNGRFGRDEAQTIVKRAHAYEAEFLRLVGPHVEMDAHQKKILAEFPSFDAVAFDYKRRAVEPKN